MAATDKSLVFWQVHFRMKTSASLPVRQHGCKADLQIRSRIEAALAYGNLEYLRQDSIVGNRTQVVTDLAKLLGLLPRFLPAKIRGLPWKGQDRHSANSKRTSFKEIQRLDRSYSRTRKNK